MLRVCLESDGGEDLICHVQAFEFHPEGMGSERRPESREQSVSSVRVEECGEHTRWE